MKWNLRLWATIERSWFGALNESVNTLFTRCDGIVAGCIFASYESEENKPICVVDNDPSDRFLY